jgi:hypothetical protein
MTNKPSTTLIWPTSLRRANSSSDATLEQFVVREADHERLDGPIIMVLPPFGSSSRRVRGVAEAITRARGRLVGGAQITDGDGDEDDPQIG